ncbi:MULTISPECIES: UDP-glucuronic acid decarboxylase family protein [Corallococcus]|uniref:UDP-glucuronic acid decarboxylase family protein n=1 Tax=Corallococcus TaxID=83461 RepID=UPI00117F2D51|nr:MULTISPECIES: UDP-glucuronic acid decarboxylase family protein [Corallococcus]NBD09206.1 NAD-dependent epimerase/dehydratase family protein [Corallococcus silvisoli]TSC31951.1 SDR family oxidoreductase [Corallococcus sp. Z5C101001]
MRGKRAVVLGGAGFVGSHLCERLLDDGAASVLAVDNLITGNEANVHALKSRAGFQFVKQDITEGLEVDGPVDFVLNLASPASPIDYANLPIETLRVGSIGTENALKLAEKKKAVFLMASTSEVYGDPLVHPQKEDYWGNVNPIGPRSVYDEAKRYSEAISAAYERSRGVNVRIVRIFNTYGPRMRLNDGRVVPAFVGQALKGEDFSVFGDGSQTRSFCYVKDLVDGLVRLVLSDVRGPVNIGNPREMTIKQFAEAVREAAGGGRQIVYHPLPKDDPKQRQPDITRARTLLGWEPKVALEDGLRDTIAYFREVAARSPAA